jgi:hypothetical protein
MTAREVTQAVKLLMQEAKYELVAAQFSCSIGTLSYHQKKTGQKKPRANSPILKPQSCM